MKKKIILIISTLIIVLVIALIIYKTGLLGEKEIKEKEFTYTPLTFEICDDDNCIYLLGSIHLGDDKITNFNKDYMKYYNKSKYLAVELDTKNVNLDVSEFMLSPQESLDDLIKEETKEKLTNFLTEKNSTIPYELLSMFKLGYIYDYLSLMNAMELGLVNSGVDEYFLTLAHEENKEIIELETYEEQLSLLFDYSNEFYEKGINDTIDNYEEGKELLKNMYESYLKGNKEELEKLISEDNLSEEELTEEEKEYQKALITDRNIKMTQNLENFLTENKDVFMIVGEAHVLGEGGIIDLLQGKNYKINIVK